MSKILIKHKKEKEVSISFDGKEYNTKDGKFLLEENIAKQLLSHGFEIYVEQENKEEVKETLTLKKKK